MSPILAGETSTATLQFPEIATSAPRELLGGDVLVYGRWPADPVRQIITLERTLGLNWDGYGSAPITPDTANTAIRLVNEIAALGFEDLPAPSVGPVHGGGLALEWSRDQRELNFAILPDAGVDFLKARTGEPFEDGHIALGFPGRLRELISWFMAR